MENSFTENKTQGYISLYRSIKSSPFWFTNERRKATHLEAWMDLLISVNHAPGFVTIGLRKVPVLRGQMLTSPGKLAEAWRWSRGRVLRFLTFLENDSKNVITSSTTKYTIISIVNYGIYQGDKIINDTTTETTDGQQTDTNNNNNNINNIKKDSINRLSIHKISFLNQKVLYEFSDFKNTSGGPLFEFIQNTSSIKYISKSLKPTIIPEEKIQNLFNHFAIRGILKSDANEYPTGKHILIHFINWIKMNLKIDLQACQTNPALREAKLFWDVYNVEASPQLETKPIQKVDVTPGEEKIYPVGKTKNKVPSEATEFFDQEISKKEASGAMWNHRGKLWDIRHNTSVNEYIRTAFISTPQLKDYEIHFLIPALMIYGISDKYYPSIKIALGDMISAAKQKMKEEETSDIRKCFNELLSNASAEKYLEEMDEYNRALQSAEVSL